MISFRLPKVSAETGKERLFGSNGKPGDQFRVLFRLSEQRTPQTAPKRTPKGFKQQVTGILISINIYVNNEIIL